MKEPPKPNKKEKKREIIEEIAVFLEDFKTLFKSFNT
jgi:hypothetical protein